MKLRGLILSVLVVAGISPVMGYGQTLTAIKSDKGLYIAAFETAQGGIKVYLPDDLDTGDKVSGTVTLDPLGATPEAKEKNRAELSTYSVELFGEIQKLKQSRVTWIIPAVTGGCLSLVDKNGMEISSSLITIKDVAPTRELVVKPAQWEYQIPPVGQSGEPFEVYGPFDGDIDTTVVSTDGKAAKVIAESPRKLIFESPADSQGKTLVEIKEKDMTLTRSYNNLRVVKIEDDVRPTTTSDAAPVQEPVARAVVQPTVNNVEEVNSVLPQEHNTVVNKEQVAPAVLKIEENAAQIQNIEETNTIEEKVLTDNNNLSPAKPGQENPGVEPNKISPAEIPQGAHTESVQTEPAQVTAPQSETSYGFDMDEKTKEMFEQPVATDENTVDPNTVAPQKEPETEPANTEPYKPAPVEEDEPEQIKSLASMSLSENALNALFTDLFAAYKRGDMDRVKSFFEPGAKVNKTDIDSIFTLLKRLPSLEIVQYNFGLTKIGPMNNNLTSVVDGNFAIVCEKTLSNDLISLSGISRWAILKKDNSLKIKAMSYRVRQIKSIDK